MVRLAGPGDEKELERLNTAFNGGGGITPESIKDSLCHNRLEVVVVDEQDGALAGFVCVQLKKSFCYAGYMAEITEVYVEPAHRRKGIAGAMIAFAETYCAQNHSLEGFSLLTGGNNKASQALYKKLGYQADGEAHLSKSADEPALPAGG